MQVEKKPSNTANLVAGIKIFLKQMPYVKWLYLINIVGWTAMYISMMVPGLVYQKLFQHLEQASSFSLGEIFTIILPQVLVMIFRTVAILIIGYFLARMLFQVDYGMKLNLINTILKEKPERNKFSMGEAINSIKEDPMHVAFALDNSLDFIGKLLYNVVVFFVLIRVDAQLTLILFLPLFVIAFVANIMSNRIINHRRKSRKGSALVSSHLGDLFNNIQAIKVQGAEEASIKRLEEYGEIRRKAMVKDSLIQELLWNMSNNISGIGTAIILIVSAAKIRNGSFTPSGFVIFNYYIYHVVSFFEWVGRQASRFQQSTVSRERMLEMTGEKEDDFLFDIRDFNLNADLPTPPQLPAFPALNRLRVEGLTSTYQGENGVRDLSFDVKKGEFFVITGRIGSGKSTLLKTLLGVKSKEAGTIYWNDQAIEPEELLPPRAAYTSQTPSLFSESIRDNVRLGHDRSPQDLERAYQDAILDKDLKGFAQGDETLIGSKGVKLSGGQKQRVAIARMLAHDSQIFLLDDVSSALDVDTELSLWQHLAKRGDTRIAVSNRPLCLKSADRVMVLKNGTMEDLGSPDDLIVTSPEFRAILGTNKQE